MTVRRLTKIQQNEDGAAIVEMAIALPVLVSMIYGIFTLGQLFEANAGIQHALGEGARYTNLCLSMSGTGSCTLPTNDQIVAKVQSKLFGTTNGTFNTPTVDSSNAADGYKTITVTYQQTMNFLFFTGPTITLTRSKRAYLASPGTNCTSNCGSS